MPPVLRPTTADVRQETEIALRPTWVRLHPQLPPTLMWGYGGHVPGPTIEVRRGRRIRIAWTNRVPKHAEYPVAAVAVPVRAPGAAPATTEPGRGGAEPDKDVAALPAWTVTHLHDAQTGGGNDGWADNAVGSGDEEDALRLPSGEREIPLLLADSTPTRTGGSTGGCRTRRSSCRRAARRPASR